jgi:hypothetical protein
MNGNKPILRDIASENLERGDFMRKLRIAVRV